MVPGNVQIRRHQMVIMILSILLGLFVFRVLAQLLQFYVEIPFLPPFEAWQSGAVPYTALLVVQIVIVIFFGWILRSFILHRIQPSRKHGWIFFIVGFIYLLIMVLRLFIGLSGLSEHYWFHSYLPTLFHFVLSGYLLVVGYFHLQATANT